VNAAIEIAVDHVTSCTWTRSLPCRLPGSRLQLAPDVVERVALGAGAVLPTVELADRCALGPPLDDVIGDEAEAARQLNAGLVGHPAKDISVTVRAVDCDSPTPAERTTPRRHH
jgi:hypothetical protein